MSESTRAPKWMSKHPCVSCETGYGFCAQFALMSLKCCKGCEHPTRWQKDAYSEEDRREMRAA